MLHGYQSHRGSCSRSTLSVWESVDLRIASLDSFALLSNAESHSFSLGSDPDQAGDSAAIRACHPLNTHVDEAVLLKLGLGVQVAHQEAALLILLSDSSHELNIESLSEVVHILAQVGDACVDLDFVLPFIVRPLLLEVQLGTVRRLQLIDEVDLDLVQVNDVLDVATG